MYSCGVQKTEKGRFAGPYLFYICFLESVLFFGFFARKKTLSYSKHFGSKKFEHFRILRYYVNMSIISESRRIDADQLTDSKCSLNSSFVISDIIAIGPFKSLKIL